jgi:hypothetical protein
MRVLFRAVLVLSTTVGTGAWGVRGHVSTNRAAIATMPADGPALLKEYRECIPTLVLCQTPGPDLLNRTRRSSRIRRCRLILCCRSPISGL